MKGKLFLLLLIVIIAVYSYITSIPPSMALEVNQVYSLTEQDKTILVNVTAANFRGAAGWLVDLAWDPYILKVTSGDSENGLRVGGTYYNIYEGPFLQDIRTTLFSANSVSNRKGQIIHLAATMVGTGQSAFGNGILASINFTVLNVGTTTIEIFAKSVIVNSKMEGLPHEETDGIVTTSEPPPIWTQSSFQIYFAVVEAVVIPISTYVVYRSRQPKKETKTEDEMFEYLD